MNPPVVQSISDCMLNINNNLNIIFLNFLYILVKMIQRQRTHLSFNAWPFNIFENQLERNKRLHLSSNKSEESSCIVQFIIGQSISNNPISFKSSPLVFLPLWSRKQKKLLWSMLLLVPFVSPSHYNLCDLTHSNA